MATNKDGHVQTNGHNNGAAGSASTENDVGTFWSRYEHAKYGDAMKNMLIEDVISRYENLMQKHNAYVEEHKQEREYAQTFRERERLLEGNISHMQKIMNRESFVMVLIDGNGMIFNNTYLKLGEDGGKAASALLHKGVLEWATSRITECPADIKVVVRVYANIKGLADVCARTGIIDFPSKFQDFVRGFTNGNTLFDFTDVGAVRGLADGKIVETFKLYLYNYHCRQLLFGCSHNSGYDRLLKHYIGDQEAMSRVTLLEGVPFGKELAAHDYRTIKFPDIFRDQKIFIPGQVDPLMASRLRLDSSNALNGASGVFTPNTNTPSNTYSPLRGIPNIDGQAMPVQLPHARQDSFTSSGATSETDGGSWSKVASKHAHRPLAGDVRPPPGLRDDTIKRNRKGQRIDGPMDYNHDEVQRIKKLKACNQHYIGVGCCHFNAGKADKCPHSHHCKFNSGELKVLRVVARETPCKKGHECDDLKCIYGHKCPFPQAAEGSMRGTGCLNGEACRFPRSMHGMDTHAVRTIKTSGMF